MIEQEYLNDLDAPLDWQYDDGVLYREHFPVEPGWGDHMFVVWDLYLVGNWPQIGVKYETPQKEFYLKLFFQENSYDIVTSMKLTVGSEDVFFVEGISKPLSEFFVLDNDGKFVNGSARKCIEIINRYWNLRAFW
jgi:hypothetical protein